MIFEQFFDIVFTIFNQILDLLPDIPDTPAIFVTLADTIVSWVASVTFYIYDIFGQAFIYILLTLGLGLLMFENIYKLVLWVIKKIPGGMS